MTDGDRLRLAILIPAYNCQDTILATLQSLDEIAAGFDRISDVIVCDDCSSDDTVARVMGARFERFSFKLLRHSRNSGEGQCYATMIESLAPDVAWFLILHADDLAMPNFIERNVMIARDCADTVATVSSNYWIFGSGEERLAHQPEEELIVWRGPGATDLEHSAMVGTWWHISGSLVRRSAWVEQGGRDTELPQLGDWDLMLRWQSAGWTIGHSLIATTRYRLAETSVSSNSYFQYRDLRERAKIIARHPTIFTGRRRASLALRMVFSGLRRTIKLASHNRWRDACRGIELTMRFGLSTLLGIMDARSASTPAIRPRAGDTE